MKQLNGCVYYPMAVYFKEVLDLNQEPKRRGRTERSDAAGGTGACYRVGGWWQMINRVLSVLHGKRKRAGKAQTRLT